MTPIFELKIPSQAVGANRMLAGAIVLLVIVPLALFFFMKVVKPSLERNPANIAGASIGIGFIAIITLVGGFLVWANFRSDAVRTVATLYEEGAKIGNLDMLVPYDELSAQIIPAVTSLQGIVVPAGDLIEVKSLKNQELKATSAIHDKTGIPKSQVDEFLRIVESKKR